ncbi:hypothetical protein [Coleofasciculus sp.]|uniref:hypothetical protein n=1 Tax=Coleofasciculus sp. TaxID=3100458 RepID=UPI003A1499A9
MLVKGARGVRPYVRTHFSMMKVYQKKARSHGFGLSAISFACAEGNRDRLLS